MSACGWLRLLQSFTDQQQRSQTVQLVRNFLQGARIGTYRCTRLLSSEVESIKGNGLLPASPALALETKIVNQYLAQFSPFAPADIAFESCTDKLVRVEASGIVSPEDARYRDLTQYWDDLHFHVA